MKDSVKI